MAVVVRLQRTGKPKEAHYRVVAIERETGPRAKPLEVLGHYHPEKDKTSERVVLNLGKVDRWLNVGARPTPTVKSLIRAARKTAPAKA